MIFHPGDEVRCINADGSDVLIVGNIYTIAGIVVAYPGDLRIKLRGDAFSIYMYRPIRFALVRSPVTEGAKAAWDSVDIDEQKLQAVWLAVPANCCSKCAAPLPCGYHS